MNRTKRAHLEALNRMHDEVYAKLRRAIEERDQAVTLNLGAEDVEPRNAKVRELMRELAAIDHMREPLQREAERTRPKWKEALTVVGGISGILGVGVAIAKAVVEWLTP